MRGAIATLTTVVLISVAACSSESPMERYAEAACQLHFDIILGTSGPMSEELGTGTQRVVDALENLTPPPQLSEEHAAVTGEWRTLADSIQEQSRQPSVSDQGLNGTVGTWGPIKSSSSPTWGQIRQGATDAVDALERLTPPVELIEYHSATLTFWKSLVYITDSRPPETLLSEHELPIFYLELIEISAPHYRAIANLSNDVSNTLSAAGCF